MLTTDNITAIPSISSNIKNILYDATSCINQIIGPYFLKYGINYFDYHRLYKDGGVIMISSDALYAEKYLLSDVKPMMSDCFNFLNEQLSWTFLSDNMPPPSGMSNFRTRVKNNICLAKSFGVCHRAYHVKQFDNYVRYCGFGFNGC